MAGYQEGAVGDGDAENRESAAEAAGSDAAEPPEAVIGALPGIVNDLPEVAPHEWIYLMS